MNRLSLLVLVSGLLCGAGCSTAIKWPAPKATLDAVLDERHRGVLATVTLGDALHVLLPPPKDASTHWQILIMNEAVLRQMTPIKPLAGRPGWWEVSFQGIRVVGRSQLRIAAVPPQAQGYNATDVFTIGVAIKRAGE